MKIKKFTALFLTFAMTMTLTAGCSKKEEAAVDSKSGKDPYEIVFVHPGEAATDMDVVLKEFYAQTQDTLNVSLKFIQAGWDDVGQKVALKISAGEKLDSAFLAQWSVPSISEAANNDQIINLDKYFNNDDYPGLKAAFSAEYLETNKFLGSDGEYHIYGIPFSYAYGSGGYVFYRKDLADKYGITIKTPADLETYYDAILANESGMTPLAFLGSQDQLKSAFYVNNSNIVKHNNSKEGLVAGRVIIKDDGTAYVSRSYVAANDPEYLKYLDKNDKAATDPFWEYEIATRFYDKGYISTDTLNTVDAQAEFMAGRAASVVRGADLYATIAKQFADALPEAELGYLAVDTVMTGEPLGQQVATLQAWNFATIPVTCEDPDRVMEFYDWIFSSQANHDLFELGVEDKHWTAVGDDKYDLMTNPDTGNSYNLGGYLMTWNPTMYRVSSTISEDVLSYIKNNSDQDYFVKDVTAGFSFDSTPVKTELALISDVASIKSALGNGMIKDYKAEVAKVDKELQKAGWEAYATEYEKQFNAYLVDHPYEGQ